MFWKDVINPMADKLSGEEIRKIKRRTGRVKDKDDRWTKIYFESQEREREKFFLNVFLDKRYNYSDELPEVHARFLIDTENWRYHHLKCRGNFIVGTSLSLEAAMNNGIIDNPKIIERIHEYRDRKWGYRINDYLVLGTTKEDIAFINETLDMVVEYLQNRIYSLE